MAWVALGLFLCIPVALWAGYRAGVKSVPPAPAYALADTPSTGQRFRVVLTTQAGSRARKMYEAAVVGSDEVLELWDGEACRGRKAGPTLEG